MPDTFEWSRAVEFHETDAAGIAHFSNFYRWMEAAEHAFLKSKGIDLLNGKHGWPRVHASCDFKKPVRFGDAITVHLTLTKRGESSLTYTTEIRVDDVLHATGKMTTVCLDLKTGRPTSLPRVLGALR